MSLELAVIIEQKAKTFFSQPSSPSSSSSSSSSSFSDPSKFSFLKKEYMPATVFSEKKNQDSSSSSSSSQTNSTAVVPSDTFLSASKLEDSEASTQTRADSSWQAAAGLVRYLTPK